MRRAALAILLCAGPLAAAPAHASTDPIDRVALRELLRQDARASGHRAVALPLPDASAASAAAGSRELARIARDRGPVRVLVGVRDHADLAGVAATLRRLGAEPDLFTTIGVLAARVPSGSALVAALRGDRRVAHIERDRELRAAQDPFDVPDPDHQGLKFTWAYDAVRAAEALAAAGGGSARTVAVIDTGLDVSHPEFAGQVARTFDTGTGGGDVTDTVGHGTFVSGLIAALDGNGIGGKGVAGATKLVAVNAEEVCDDGTRGCFTVSDLVRGIEFSIRSGADVINMSLAGEGFNPTDGRALARALEAAFFNDVLLVAASGNNAERPANPNPLEFPAGAVGGRRGGRGIGLSVAATTPSGAHAGFSNHNDFVSLSAPGASDLSCEFGVFSTLPANSSEWDVPGSCSRVLIDAGGARFAYAEGTSFAAPIASGIAALAWQVESRLASEQVADVLTASARQTVGSGWNEFTGAGVVDGQAATTLARTYDVIAPRARGSARRRPRNRVAVRLERTRDRTEAGRELAGKVTYGLLVSRDGGRTYSVLVSRRSRPFSLAVRLRGRRVNLLVASACDGNGNCGIRRLGRFRAR